MTAFEALLKGLLESDLPIELVYTTKDPAFLPVLELAGEERHAAILKRHGMSVQTVPTAARGVRLAMQAAGQGRHAVTLVPNEQVDEAIAEVATARRKPLGPGACTLILEDDPEIVPWLCPRVMSGRLGLACLEPADLATLRSSMEHAIRLARTSRRPSVLVVHRQLLHSSETLAGAPNRVHEAADIQAMLKRRRRKLRLPDSDDVLRVARRLELARLLNLPSPGERVPVGFVLAGPASIALKHLLYELRLFGRVPLLELTLVRPLDQSVLSRFLLRCENAVVLETRPGSVEAEVLEIAEQMRRAGERPAVLWGRRLPPTDDGESPMLLPGEALSPSILARRILHLLHRVRPGRQIAARLVPTDDRAAVDQLVSRLQAGTPSPLARVRRVLQDVRAWAAERTDPETGELRRTHLLEEGDPLPTGDARYTIVEWWSADRFLREGHWAVRQAALDRRPRLMLVVESPPTETTDLERFAKSALPGDVAQPVRVVSVAIDHLDRLRDELRAAATNDGVHVVIVGERFSGRATDDRRQRESEVDRLGFEPIQRRVRPVEDACRLRAGTTDDSSPTSVSLPEPGFNVDRVPLRSRRWFRVRLRPRYEIVEVVRSKPPVMQSVFEERARLPIPTAVHSKQPAWRVFLAGTRGRGEGIAARVLMQAGRAMGFHVRSRSLEGQPAEGTSGWAEVLFTHPRDDEDAPPLSAQIPWGEADVILASDPVLGLHAIGNDPSFRIASPQRTHMIADLGAIAELSDGEERSDPRQEVIHLLQTCAGAAPNLLGDVSRACRTAFGTDRLVDFVLIGAAFQHGLIPVTLDAMERAVTRAQESGYGRSLAAFEFGRRLTIDPRPLERAREERQEPLDRLIRRYGLALYKRRWRGEVSAAVFRKLMERMHREMPGLLETDGGRESCRDFVVALYRLILWGGSDHAKRYFDLIQQLYNADRGDRGRIVTRRAILPLADALLIRDSLYLARLATSLEHRQRMRAGLRIYLPRGDELIRRYLNRLEVIALGYRARLEFVSSDWTAYAVRLLLNWLPAAWRGTKLDRMRRQYLQSLVGRLPAMLTSDYDEWAASFRQLASLTIEDRLHRVSVRQLRLLLEPDEADDQTDEEPGDWDEDDTGRESADD